MDSNFNYKINDLANNGYKVEIGKYINLAWEHFKKHPGMYIGFMFLSGIASSMAQNIPYIGIIISTVISPLLAVGTAIVVNKSIQSRTVEFNDFFDGFRAHNKPVQIILFTLVMSLIMLVCCIPILVMSFPLLMEVFSDFSGMGEGHIPTFDFDYDYSIFESPVYWITAGLTMIPIIYLSVAWSWTSFFIVFKKMDFWPAMEASRKIIGKKWFSIFGFGFVLAGLILLGMLCLLVGLFVAIPVVTIANFVAFEQIVGLNEDPELDISDHLIDDFS